MFNILRQFGLHGGPPQTFDAQYTCFSLAVIDKENHATSGKIILPVSALHHLEMIPEVEYPLIFEVLGRGKSTHTGVYEFTADEGKCYMPFWVMENIGVEEGDIVRVRYTRLPKGSFIKLQAQSVDFLQIHNPRAVLEKELRGFAALTVGDIVHIQYNDRDYALAVREAKPALAIATNDTDLFLEFDAPVGYVEPEPVFRPAAAAAAPVSGSGSTAAAAAATPPPAAGSPAVAPVPAPKLFSGRGFRLDGKPVAETPTPNTTPTPSAATPVTASRPPSTTAAAAAVTPTPTAGTPTPQQSADASTTAASKFPGTGRTLRG